MYYICCKKDDALLDWKTPLEIALGKQYRTKRVTAFYVLAFVNNMLTSYHLKCVAIMQLIICAHNIQLMSSKTVQKLVAIMFLVS